MADTSSQCKIHRLPITSFCNAHKAIMCMNCLLVGHSGCIKDVIAIQAAIREAAEKRVSIQSEFDDLTEELDKRCAAKEKRLRHFKAVTNHLREGIRQIRFKLLDRINQISRNALDLINSVMDEQTDAIKNEISNLLELKDSLAPILAKLNEDMKDKVELATELEEIYSSIINIRAELYNEHWSAGEVEVHFLVSSSVTDTLDTLNSLGEILVDDLREKGERRAVESGDTPTKQLPNVVRQRSAYVPFRQSIVGAIPQEDTGNGPLTSAFLIDALPRPCGKINPYTYISEDPVWETYPRKSSGPPALPTAGGIKKKGEASPAVKPRIMIYPPSSDSSEKTNDEEPVELRLRQTDVDSEYLSDGSPSRNRQGKVEMLTSKDTLDRRPPLEVALPKDTDFFKGNVQSLGIKSGSKTVMRIKRKVTTTRANSDSDLHRDIREKLALRAHRSNSFDPTYISQQTGPCRLTGVAALSKGRLVICDYAHDHLQLVGAHGALMDRYRIRKPFDVCTMGGNRFAATSVERSSVGIFNVNVDCIYLEREMKMEGEVTGYGISFVNGLFSIACRRRVRVMEEDLSTMVASIESWPDDLKRSSGILRWRKPQFMFCEATYTVIDQNGETPLLYVSDKMKDVVVCVDINSEMKWKAHVSNPGGLLLHKSLVYITSKRKVVVLEAATGMHIADLKERMPRHPLALAFSEAKQVLVVTSFKKKTADKEELLQTYPPLQ